MKVEEVLVGALIAVYSMTPVMAAYLAFRLRGCRSAARRVTLAAGVLSSLLLGYALWEWDRSNVERCATVAHGRTC